GRTGARPARRGRCRGRKRWAWRSRLPGDAAVEPAGAVAVRYRDVLGAPQAGEGDAGFGTLVGLDQLQALEEALDLRLGAEVHVLGGGVEHGTEALGRGRRLVIVGEVRQRQVASRGNRGYVTRHQRPRVRGVG